MKKTLTMGVDSPSPTEEESERRIAILKTTVESYLPDFVKAVESETDIIVLHQDAFAAGYDDDEYTLLGMAIKYAGLHGKELTIIGKSHETF